MSITLKSRILVVDDEAGIQKLFQKILQEEGHTCQTASSVREAKSLMQDGSFDLVITDLKMPGESGIDLLRYCAQFYPETGRLLITGYSDMETAREILQIGVYGYLIKPLGKDQIRITIQNSLRHMLLENQMQACLAEAKKEVIEKNLTLEAILNNIDVGVTVLDRDMRILSHNRRMGLMFPNIQSRGIKHCHDVITYQQDTGFCNNCPMAKAFEFKTPAHEERMILTEDGYKEFRVSALPIIEEDKSIRRGMLLFHDVTDIMENQKTASESNKLVAVGQLAAGIAHEINTPSQYLGDNIRYLKDSFNELQPLLQMTAELEKIASGDQQNLQDQCAKMIQEADQVDLEYLLEEVPVAIQQSLEGMKRISDIVKAMKDFSHPGDQEKNPTDINELIKTTTTVCRNEWKYVAEVKFDFAPDLPPVECLASEISQVILILVVNGAHSIEEKIAHEKQMLGQIHVTTRQPDDGHIEIIVRDSGLGIPQDIRDKIFQSFFTTKKRGKGTGQGLAMAQTIITENHGGELTFTSEVDQWTEFSIILPVHATNPAEPSQTQ